MAAIPAIDVYKTIREEVIEQKKCQFQMLTAAVTFTTAAWAFVSHDTGGSLGYLAPLALDIAALVMILDKAKSIQRMVGYLQLIEKNQDREWRWESDLDEFRGWPSSRHKMVVEKPSVKSEDRSPSEDDQTRAEADKRKHSYITTVGVVLLVQSWFCFAFYSVTLNRAYEHGINRGSVICRLLLLALSLGGLTFGLIWFLHVRKQLTKGAFRSSEIESKWKDVIESKQVEHVASIK